MSENARAARNWATDTKNVKALSGEAPPPPAEAFPMSITGATISAIGIAVAATLLRRKRT